MKPPAQRLQVGLWSQRSSRQLTNTDFRFNSGLAAATRTEVPPSDTCFRFEKLPPGSFQSQPALRRPSFNCRTRPMLGIGLQRLAHLKQRRRVQLAPRRPPQKPTPPAVRNSTHFVVPRGLRRLSLSFFVVHGQQTYFAIFALHGRLAQLVQSTSFTPRGSGVRVPHRPHHPTKKSPCSAGVFCSCKAPNSLG